MAGTHFHWLVIRNRFSRGRLVDDGLDTLAMRLGFRPLDGCAERIVYRQLFPPGLTACDSSARSCSCRAMIARAAARLRNGLYFIWPGT